VSKETGEDGQEEGGSRKMASVKITIATATTKSPTEGAM
jgi:hypothetical protein